MRACVNEATTMSTDYETDMRAYAAAGFKAVELWLDKLIAYSDTHGVDRAASLLRDLGLEPVCACAQGGLMLVEGPDRRRVLNEYRQKLSLCRALGVPKMVIFPGCPGEPAPELYERIVENVQEAADIAAGYGVTLALEFIRGHPVVGCMGTALELAHRARRDNVGVLFDFFHFAAGISKMSDLEALPAEALTFVHVNDAPAMPREMLTDAHRVWLGEGCFLLDDFRSHLLRLKYSDGVSIELFDRDVWEQDPYEVAALAYRNVTAFVDGDL